MKLWMLLLGVAVLGGIGAFSIGHSRCYGVPIQEYRYCKRIGYEAYDAKRDTAYWAQYGMKP